MENKELAVVKGQATKALQAAQALVITNNDEYTLASDLVAKVKQVGKIITAQKETITKPLNEALKNARDLFRPIEESHAQAERLIKDKMLAYQAVQDTARREAEAKAMARVEKGTMKLETAVKKLESVAEAPTKTDNSYTITTYKVEIEDETLIPREYLVPDLVIIKEALKQGKVIPGTILIEIKDIRSRS